MARRRKTTTKPAAKPPVVEPPALAVDEDELWNNWLAWLGERGRDAASATRTDAFAFAGEDGCYDRAIFRKLFVGRCRTAVA